MNFFVNKAMGIGNSGVEHAEFYRKKMFERKSLPYRFIFVDLIPNLHEAMKKWNISNTEVINMWEFFSFGKTLLTDEFTKEKFFYQAKIIVDSTNTNRERITETSSGLHIVEHIVKFPRKDKKQLMVSVSRVDIYITKTGEKKISFEYLEDPHRDTRIANIHIYDFDNKHLFFQNEVLLRRFFFEQLNLIFGEPSNFIIDRDEISEVALFNNRIPKSRLIEVIHADHLADRDDLEFPLWNNYYEYLLTHIEMVDKVVVATELQKKDLLIDFPSLSNKFVVIPVGGVRDRPFLPYNKNQIPPFKLITMSRLAQEKHIDLDIKAVCVLHSMGYDIIFDIYGQGGERGSLQKLIDSNKAGSYIHLKGLTDKPDDVYPNYNAFISASFSEGFGLTYIEALNASLPVLTFKARFGALELIKNNVNGFLKDYKRNDDKFNISNLVEGLVQLQNVDVYNRLRARTSKTVEQYQDHVIANKWRKLIDEL